MSSLVLKPQVIVYLTLLSFKYFVEHVAAVNTRCVGATAVTKSRARRHAATVVQRRLRLGATFARAVSRLDQQCSR